MTESTPERTRIHMQATFHEEGHEPETVELTIADPAQPLIIISVGACPENLDVIDIGMDVSGFAGPDQTLDFLEQLIVKMRTTKAEQLLEDGTRIPYEGLGKPEAAKSE